MLYTECPADFNATMLGSLLCNYHGSFEITDYYKARNILMLSRLFSEKEYYYTLNVADWRNQMVLQVPIGYLDGDLCPISKEAKLPSELQKHLSYAQVQLIHEEM